MASDLIKHDQKISDGKITGGRGMWVEFSEWVTDMKIYASHVNTHQRLTSAEKDCDNQVDDKTLLGDTSQPLSTAPPLITQ